MPPKHGSKKRSERIQGPNESAERLSDVEDERGAMASADQLLSIEGHSFKWYHEDNDNNSIDVERIDARYSTTQVRRPLPMSMCFAAALNTVCCEAGVGQARDSVAHVYRLDVKTDERRSTSLLSRPLTA